MKHFEINYAVGQHYFTYKCTTAYEALEALDSIRMHDPSAVEGDKMDEYMKELIDLKEGRLLKYATFKLQIRYVDGEV